MRRELFLLVIIAALLYAAPAARAEDKNFLVNGALQTGAGNSPDGWRSESWDQKPEVTSYEWHHDSGIPELVVNNMKPNDARWLQTLNLAEGWYFFSGEIRSENAGKDMLGVNISVMEDGIMSEDLRGTQDWKPVGFYLKIGKKGAEVEVALRVGGFSNLNTGKGFFRNVKCVRSAAPPAGAAHVFDLEEIRKQSAPVPTGSPWSLAAVFVLLAAIAYVGWLQFGAVPEVAAQVKSPAKTPDRDQPLKRAGARRANRR